MTTRTGEAAIEAEAHAHDNTPLVIKMGDVAGYGPYVEADQAIPVTFEGEKGEYLHAMYFDEFGATAAGREMGAYPKLPGKPPLVIEEGALVGRRGCSSTPT